MGTDAEFYKKRWKTAIKHAKRFGAEVVLSGEPSTVQWLTGWFKDIEANLAPWTLGDYVVATIDQCILFTAEGEQAKQSCPGIKIFDYSGYTILPEIDAQENVVDGLPKILQDIGIRTGDKIAIEGRGLHLFLEQVLQPFHVIPFDHDIQKLRVVKDFLEIEHIRKATAVVNAGQMAFREHLASGLTEMDLWTKVHTEMVLQAGQRLPMLVDLMSGSRCAEIGAPPSRKKIAADELCLCDLSPRVNGYWSDSCVTLNTGKPTLSMLRLHDTIRRALDAGIQYAKPGILAGELDAVIRGVMEKGGYTYPHHSGHGIGVNYHEEPRIVPNSTRVLESGMVIALEPGAYIDELGIRLEHVILLSDNDTEVITQYPLDLTK